MQMTFKTMSIWTAFILIGTSCNTYADEPVTRALQFLTNVHSGKSMKADEWLTRQVRSEPAFNAHGGLDAMIKQSTARAERHGGLKSVEVLKSTKTNYGVDVQLRVLFKKDPGMSMNAPNSSREEMIWEITVIKEDGNWKLSF